MHAMKLPISIPLAFRRQTSEVAFPRVRFQGPVTAYEHRPDTTMAEICAGSASPNSTMLMERRDNVAPLSVWYVQGNSDGASRFLLQRDAPDGMVMGEYPAPELPMQANYRMVTEHPRYRELLSMLGTSDGVKKTTLPRRWKAAIIFALILAVMALLAIPPAAPLQGVRATVQAPAPAASAQVVATQLVGEELGILAEVVSRSGISIDARGGAPFVLFSDPNCPACRSLEVMMKNDGYKFAPLIIPVAYKPGSMDVVASVLCSENVGAAWLDAIAGKPLGPVCAAGMEQARKNNEAFEALKFNATPTLVSATGKIAHGTGNYAGLMEWVKANSVNVPGLPSPTP
jgi:hypothetical protein